MYDRKKYKYCLTDYIYYKIFSSSLLCFPSGTLCSKLEKILSYTIIDKTIHIALPNDTSIIFFLIRLYV